MNRNEALALVHEFVKNDYVVKHMLEVEGDMLFYAE